MSEIKNHLQILFPDRKETDTTCIENRFDGFKRLPKRIVVVFAVAVATVVVVLQCDLSDVIKKCGATFFISIFKAFM
jgi:hypothetical protein